jgi:hypothetical protein
MNAAIAPGPWAPPIIGNLLDMQKNRLAFFGQLARDYGDIARLKLAGTPAHLVLHPDGIRRVLQDNSPTTTRNRGASSGCANFWATAF